MVIQKYILCALAFLLISGCETSSQKVDPMASFIGKPISEARTELGKPDRMYDMQDGTFEYIWSRFTGIGSGTGFMGVQIAQGTPKGCNRVLITNQQKTVIAFRNEGKC